MEYSKVQEECWNLDFALINWLNLYLKQYYEDASKHIDLDYKKYNFNNKEYSQRQLIERLITITEILKDENTYFDYGEEVKNLVDELYDIMKLIHFDLWW